MNEKQIEKWKNTRAKGLNLYVIKWALFFGGWMTVGRVFINRYFDGEWTADKLISTFIWYLILGAIIGWITYRSTERTYKKAVNNKTEK